MQAKKQAITDVQKTQNKLLRILEKKKISDKIKVTTMLKSQDMLSVNQTTAQIKLVEMWKAKHVEVYPINIRFLTTVGGRRTTCGETKGKALETGKTSKARTSFIGDSTRTWNRVLDRNVESKTCGGIP